MEIKSVKILAVRTNVANFLVELLEADFAESRLLDETLLQTLNENSQVWWYKVYVVFPLWSVNSTAIFCIIYR